MTIHIGVDLHQRFCYMTAVNASGRKLRQRQGQVANDGPAVRAWLRGLEGIDSAAVPWQVAAMHSLAAKRVYIILCHTNLTTNIE